MHHRIVTFILVAVFWGCSSSNKSDCPSTTAITSNLEVAPSPKPEVILHPNGKDATWNWQLTETLNTSYDVDVYDVDLFETTSSQIAALQADGKKVVCYFSAGSSEEYRDDFDTFDESDLGKPLDGWEGERWLDIRSQNVLDLMEQRLDLAASKGCDGVEPDNMDGYQQDTCFDLTQHDQLAYNRAIANMARERGLSVALKNTPDLVEQLVDYFDFSVSEQCYYYEECDRYFPFITQNKPVFNAEYETSYRSDPEQSEVCGYSNTHDVQTLILDLDLNDSYRHACF
jgi:hypothetical protein